MEALEQKLKKGKAKAEAETKRKLQEKAAEREKSLVLKQEAEMQRLLEREKNGTAARLKRIALKHKHMVQMEEFRWVIGAHSPPPPSSNERCIRAC